MTTIETKVHEVQETISIASNKCSEKHINDFLDTLCKYRNIILECKEKLYNLNTSLYDEIFDEPKIYNVIKKDLKKLRNSLIKLLTSLKQSKQIYSGAKTVIKEFSSEINLFKEIIGDLELKNEVLPNNKNISTIFNNMK